MALPGFGDSGKRAGPARPSGYPQMSWPGTERMEGGGGEGGGGGGEEEREGEGSKLHVEIVKWKGEKLYTR